MKHDVLRSIAHNVAASLASGIGLLIGAYELNVFGEAAQSPEGFITVDFLNGATSGGKPSPSLFRAIQLYRDKLPDLCAKHGASVDDFAELNARYNPALSGGRFTVTIADKAGHRTSTEYGGGNGQRVKILDGEGRIRPKPVQRSV